MSYKETMIKKYGSLELWKAHLKAIGSKGGKNGNTGGFAANPELASRAGKIGGAKSKRRPKGEL